MPSFFRGAAISHGLKGKELLNCLLLYSPEEQRERRNRQRFLGRRVEARVREDRRSVLVRDAAAAVGNRHALPMGKYRGSSCLVCFGIRHMRRIRLRRRSLLGLLVCCRSCSSSSEPAPRQRDVTRRRRGRRVGRRRRRRVLVEHRGGGRGRGRSLGGGSGVVRVVVGVVAVPAAQALQNHLVLRHSFQMLLIQVRKKERGKKEKEEKGRGKGRERKEGRNEEKMKRVSGSFCRLRERARTTGESERQATALARERRETKKMIALLVWLVFVCNSSFRASCGTMSYFLASLCAWEALAGGIRAREERCKKSP